MVKEYLSDDLGFRSFELAQLQGQTMINDEKSDVIPKTPLSRYFPSKKKFKKAFRRYEHHFNRKLCYSKATSKNGRTTLIHTFGFMTFSVTFY